MAVLSNRKERGRKNVMSLNGKGREVRERKKIPGASVCVTASIEWQQQSRKCFY